nr:PREDICTED: uncharacterized protein LOC105674200 [Linepithema humile]XP_012225806.1 PREDICTED: uncharacterized protein LOC105674200 [Linepithema humile]
MQSGSSLNQFNDDDFFSDGPCPSCRLAINKETGRLKWCTGANKTWRFRIKLMLLIPALLLPITIIFIVLSQFQTTTKISDSHAFEDNIFEVTSRNDVEHAAEKTEEDRLLLLDLKTSYVPTDMYSPLRSLQRRKRNIDKVLNLQETIPNLII